MSEKGQSEALLRLAQSARRLSSGVWTVGGMLPSVPCPDAGALL